MGLDPLGANLFLQQTVRYDLGNVFDPAYTMVCKVQEEGAGAGRVAAVGFPSQPQDSERDA